MQRDVTTTYLQMLAASELKPSLRQDPAFCFAQVQRISPELNRFFYTAVGGEWFWLDRLSWSYQQWLDYLSQPTVQTWLGTYHGIPIGYCELVQEPDGSAQIGYFGLLAQWYGQGFGGMLLTAVIQQAWQLTTSRVWVHTCTLDGPTALANYQARGFTIYAQKTELVELPNQAPGPWLGAFPQSV
ncbi:GNAT family N-acetyltransferase [Herpetosiphon sp. NSE202]|uniref:GNAT family N-acetyltransferase n=1 Tax=Herpetosiphon sp. NSE202 TaxID=3351349 RepID=UPI0036346804